MGKVEIISEGYQRKGSTREGCREMSLISSDEGDDCWDSDNGTSFMTEIKPGCSPTMLSCCLLALISSLSVPLSLSLSSQENLCPCRVCLLKRSVCPRTVALRRGAGVS